MLLCHLLSSLFKSEQISGLESGSENMIWPQLKYSSFLPPSVIFLFYPYLLFIKLILRFDLK